MQAAEMNLSGVLYLVLICSRSESQVFQSPDIKVLEWKPVEIHCNQNITTSDPLFWYQQQPNKNPQLLVYAHSGTKEEGHFKMNISEKGLSATLSTHRIEVNDAAVYYCAVRPAGNGKLVFGSGTKLLVQPKKKSETAAFVLGSDEDNKKGKARACLITDFSSHNINVTLNDTTVSVDPSVIEGEEQYSVVAFLPESKERSNFKCNVFVNGTPTEGNNTDIENVCVSDLAYVFESDENLNSLSLMVLGLRVIFLKSIVFNVLMTVRAWMS